MAKTNVLVVYADQWRASALAYAGDVNVQTPHLDAFARESVNCHAAVSGCPVCCPARASLLTGRYPHEHGVFLNDVPLDPGLPTLGKIFRQAGYRTAWVGKWHIDGHGRYAYIPPERRQGFDYFKAMECTHLYNHSRYYDNDDPTMRVWEGYDAVAQTDDLIHWLGQKGDDPFMAVLSWGPPHNPYDSAPERYRAMYDAGQLVLRENVPADMEKRARSSLAGYYAHCTALDDAMGKLLRVLDERGLRENTAVLFLSDHGDFVGSHGLWDKQGPWEESIRVPLLLRAPGLRPGVSDVVIDHVDLLPTLCSMCGLQTPERVSGRDIAHHLASGQVPEDNAAVLAAYCTFGNWPRIASKREPLLHAREFRGLRTSRYTYVEELGREPWLLYDNDADPYQMNNLIGTPAVEQVQREFAHRLGQRLSAIGDRFTPGAQLVQNWGYQVNAEGTIPIKNWAG